MTPTSGWSVQPVGCDDAAHHGVDGPSGGHRQGRLMSRIADLAEQVDDLLAPTDEVASGDLAVAKDHLEALTASPSMHHPGHACVRTTGLRQHVCTLAVLELSLIHI